LVKLIRTGDFCEVVTDKFIHENVKRGHLMYVAGHKALPVSDEDPYTQRITFFARLYNQFEKKMGKEIYIIDPISIRPFSAKKQKRLLEEYKHANGID